MSDNAATAAAKKPDPADLRTSIRTSTGMGDAARQTAVRQNQRAEEFRAQSRYLAGKEGMAQAAQQAAREAANLEAAAQNNVGRAAAYQSWAATLTRLLGA